MNHGAFRKELEQCINKHSIENGSNTPDYILAQYLFTCLMAFDEAVKCREVWFGRIVPPSTEEIQRIFTSPEVTGDVDGKVKSTDGSNPVEKYAAASEVTKERDERVSHTPSIFAAPTQAMIQAAHGLTPAELS